MNLLFHPRVSAPPPMPGLHTHAEMIAAHKARQARYAAAVALQERARRAIMEEARQVCELNEKAAAEAVRIHKQMLAALRAEGKDPELRSIATYPSIRKIIVAVAQAYEVAPICIMSAKRTQDVMLPRHVAMYLAKTTTLRSLPEIGRQFGGRDHTTVLHAVRKMAARMAVDDAFRGRVEALRAALTEAQA